MVAVDLFGPPLLNVRVRLGLVRFVQHLAEGAPSVGREAIHAVVLAPSEIVFVQVIVLVQEPQVLGQLTRRLKVPRVDVRIGRSVRVVVRFSVHHRDNSTLQSSVQLVRDVVRAEGILEGQRELVLFSQHLLAL